MNVWCLLSIRRMLIIVRSKVYILFFIHIMLTTK